MQETSAYGSDYVNWKRWGSSDRFGHYDFLTPSYFDAQINKAKLLQIQDVLEIGFGAGAFLAFARSRGWSVTGVEQNPMLLKLAVDNGYRAIPADQLDALADQSFDLIVAFDVLEHIATSDLVPFLQTLHRKLRDDGALVARFPNGDSFLGLPCQNGDITHLTALGSGKVHYLAGVSGFEVVSLGAPCLPLRCGSLKFAAHRLASRMLSALLGFVFKILYYPTDDVTLFSPTLLAVLRKVSVRQK